MKNRFLKIKETKGSGIFTVLIAVLFLTAFGTLLLTLTYTSYSMKIAERQGKVVVYNASTAMDEIRVGVQSAVSDSIKKTYKDVMTDYNYYAGNIKDTFALKFSEEIEKYTYTPAGGEPKPLLNPSGNTYNLDVLEAYIKEDRGGVKSVTSDSYTLSNNLGAYTKDEATGVITLKGVHIEYSKGGRESSVTSDIVITPPDIGFYLTQYAITGIPEFTLITKGSIIHKDGITTQIEGSAYANSVVLNSGASSTLNIKKGSLICAGDIEANPGSNFNVAKNASVWAKNIVLDNSSNVSLLGSTYLADDLELNGTGSSATLGGSYFGFGTDVRDSAKSSSILVNGSNCTLDLSDLKDLIIAGFSFIGNEGRSYYSYAGITETDSNKDELRVRRNAMMGESIAVKGNQLAYIVPASAVNMVSWQVQEGINDVYEAVFETDDEGNVVYDDEGNPIVISQELISEGEDDFVRNDDGSPYNPTVKKVQGNPMIIKNSDFNAVIQFYIEGDTLGDYDATKKVYEVAHNSTQTPFDGGEKSYTDYGMTLKPIVFNWTDQTKAVYIFAEFDTPQHANEFFKDYYELKPNDIGRNLKNYANLYNGNDSSGYNVNGANIPSAMTSMLTAGTSYKYDGTVVSVNEDTYNALVSQANFLGERYDLLCRTLSNGELQTEATNPYDCYINTALVNSLPQRVTVFKDKSGKVLAKIINSSNPDSVYSVKDGLDGTEYSTEVLIIANCKVKVDASGFKGLIICAGDIQLEQNATFSTSDVIASYISKAADGSQIKDYFNFDVTEEYVFDEGSAGAPWDVEELVAYENWKSK